MTEYIVHEDEHGMMHLNIPVEPVVRCRDCRYSTPSEAWPGCMNCERTGLAVEPNGFCAWGERRDA